MGRILAIDIGQKRIGLAVTDPQRIIATPLDTVNVNSIWEFLQSYVTGNEVDLFVAGLPVQTSGEPSSAMRFVEPFVKKLRKQFPSIEVCLWDERYTSVMAQAAIRDSGVNRKTRQDKALVDKVSATILLQSFMQSREISNQFNK